LVSRLLTYLLRAAARVVNIRDQESGVKLLAEPFDQALNALP